MKNLINTKRLSLLFLLPIIMIGFFACQKIKEEIAEGVAEVTTTSVTTNLSVPLLVDEMNETSQGDSIVFNIDKQYKLSEHPIVQAYKEKLQDLEIIGLQVKVVDAVPSNMILEQAQFILHKVNDTHLFECNITQAFALTTDNIYTINKADADWEVINNILNDLADIQVQANGVAACNSEAFEHINFEFIIKVRATISVDI